MKKIFVLFILFFVSLGVLSAQVEKSVKNSANNSAKVGSTNSTQAVNVVTYDFTVAGAAYVNPNVPGNPPMVIVDNVNGQDVYAMAAGDANSSGIISNSDVDPVNTDLNNAGYYDSDINMSGIVTNADVDFINSNLNKSSQVPN